MSELERENEQLRQDVIEYGMLYRQHMDIILRLQQEKMTMLEALQKIAEFENCVYTSDVFGMGVRLGHEHAIKIANAAIKQIKH